jgi:hypothetical protein
MMHREGRNPSIPRRPITHRIFLIIHTLRCHLDAGRNPFYYHCIQERLQKTGAPAWVFELGNNFAAWHFCLKKSENRKKIEGALFNRMEKLVKYLRGIRIFYIFQSCNLNKKYAYN